MPRKLTCELCNSEFRCGAPGKCWCSTFNLEPRKRLILSAVAKDCVCRDCLSKLNL